MPKPRKQLISLEATPYYHCVSRCVRRAFLCGFDRYSDKSYEHRRSWVEERIHFLAAVFSIDVCAYAVMSNHLHLVLHIDGDSCSRWTDLKVCQHWMQLYKGTPLTQRFLNGEILTHAEMDAVSAKLAQWRDQLCDISWFMRALNEPIARHANEEDGCTGRFWEGRFSSQALLDEKALIACMAYVDLNPVRASMAKTPETSDHTSVKRRCETLKNDNAQPQTLMPFVGNPREPMPTGLPFHFQDYLKLVDWTGRIIRMDKRGSISETQPDILTRLTIPHDKWLILTTKFESRFKSLVGTKAKLVIAARHLGFQRTPGLSACEALLH